jgi:glycosyltransferase involved in cell wall biosynthesis
MKPSRDIKAKGKILFLVPYPTEGASARLRVGQFLPYLENAGFGYSVRPFYTASFYRILYKKGNAPKKVFLFLAASMRRFIDVFTAPFYSVIFIHREVFPIGPPILESVLFGLRFFARNKIIFDYDDAIYLPPQGSSKAMGILKCPRKTDFIIKHSDLVIAGNEFLKEHTKPLNKNVVIIPTCIDTDNYNKAGMPGGLKNNIVIGWIGSHTTQVFLEELENIFRSLLDKNRSLKVHIVGGRLDSLRHDGLVAKEWSLETERDDMAHFDIGIMPMPDTDWTRGKCAFKAILYMSMGIPVVVSPVGVNKDIIKDGVNGYLAFHGKEWEEKLSRLVGDAGLRRSIGEAGRATAVEKYSLKTNAPKFVEALVNVGSRSAA